MRILITKHTSAIRKINPNLITLEDLKKKSNVTSTLKIIAISRTEDICMQFTEKASKTHGCYGCENLSQQVKKKKKKGEKGRGEKGEEKWKGSLK